MRGLAVAAAAVLAAAPARIAAQSAPVPLLSFVGGEMRYRLADTRNGALFGFRLSSPFVPLGFRHWTIEAATSYGWFRTDAGERRHVFLPDLQLQLHTGTDPVQGYVGGGGGLGIVHVDSNFTTSAALTASVGARLRLSQRWGIAGELRLRSYDLFEGTTKELTIALFQRLE